MLSHRARHPRNLERRHDVSSTLLDVAGFHENRDDLVHLNLDFHSSLSRLLVGPRLAATLTLVSPSRNALNKLAESLG